MSIYVGKLKFQNKYQLVFSAIFEPNDTFIVVILDIYPVLNSMPFILRICNSLCPSTDDWRWDKGFNEQEKAGADETRQEEVQWHQEPLTISHASVKNIAFHAFPLDFSLGVSSLGCVKKLTMVCVYNKISLNRNSPNKLHWSDRKDKISPKQHKSLSKSDQ